MSRPSLSRARFLIPVVAVGAVALAMLPGATSTAAPDTTTAIGFDVPRVVDPIHTYGEPDIRVGPDGTMYVSGPQGTGVQRSIWNSSVDNGDSYRLVQDKKLPNDPSTLTQAWPTKSTLGPGGGDTEILVTRDNRVYYSDLYALVCFTTAYSDNHGADVHSTPAGCSSPGADRQWFAAFEPQPSDHTISPYTGPKPLIYQKYTALTSGSKVDWMTANDPGNWHLNDQAGLIAGSGDVSPTDAPIVIDQHTGDLLTIVEQGGDNGLAFAIGEPAADGSAHLTFKYEPIIATLPGDSSTLFPAFTQDRARNVYAVWVDDTTFQVSYMWAAPTADGKDWGAWHGPYTINQPPSLTNVMPWVAGGGDGIIDVVWYGTDKSLKELGPDGPSAQKDQAWWTYFAQIDKANTTNPHIVPARASQHPMKYNDICLLGTGCITATGNRNLADFFEVTIDNDGRARIVYNDTSNGLVSVLGTVEAADHPGAALVNVTTQETGLNAWTGKPLTPAETRAPLQSVTDPSGDALFPVINGNKVNAADITKVSLALGDKVLRITATLKDGTLADVGPAAGTLFGRLVVRWQMGNTLYHAGVDESAAGAATYFAGQTKTTDSCSVSACDPHVLDYIAPPLPNAAAASGNVKTTSSGTTYTIDVPLSAIGNPTTESLLEEVSGYVFASLVPGSVQNTKPQTDLDEVPLELEGTRTFNFQAASVPGGVLPPATPGGKHGPLATTGLPIALPFLALVLVGVAVLLRRRKIARP